MWQLMKERGLNSSGGVENQFILTRVSPSLAETGCHFLNLAFNSHFGKTGSLTQGVREC